MIVTTRQIVPEIRQQDDFEPDQYRYACRLIHQVVHVIDGIPEDRRGVLAVLMMLDKYSGGSDRRRRGL